MSDSLQPHGLQQARFPCPSPSPGVSSNSSPLSWWCHPTISFSIIPFSSCLQYFPASGSFLMGWPFTSGGQSIGASASASVLPINILGWFSLGLTGLIFLQSKGLSGVFSNTIVQKHQFFNAHLSLWSNSYLYMTSLWKDYTFINIIYYPICANCMKDGHLWTVVILKWRNSNMYQLLLSSVAFCWSPSPTWKLLSLRPHWFSFFHLWNKRTEPNLLWYAKAVIGFLSIYLSQFNSAKKYRMYTLCQLSCRVLGYGDE